MTKMTLSSIDVNTKEFIDKSKQDIESKSINLQSVISDIINVYCTDLDILVAEISAEINKNELDNLTDQQLESYCLKLSAMMYFSGSGQELIGLRENIAKAVYKEKYNEAYSEAEGTIADKKAASELLTQEYDLIDMVYDHAQKIMQSKLTYAVHLLTSLRRVLARRVEQMKLNPVGIKYSVEG